LFGAWTKRPVPYQYDRISETRSRTLVVKKILTQVVRESTLAHREFLNKAGKPTRQLDIAIEIAGISVQAIYYKVGGRPVEIKRCEKGSLLLGLAYKSETKEH